MSQLVFAVPDVRCIYILGLLVVGIFLLEDSFDDLGFFLLGHVAIGLDGRLVSADSEIVQPS